MFWWCGFWVWFLSVIVQRIRRGVIVQRIRRGVIVQRIRRGP